jgi:hypothetical protein
MAIKASVRIEAQLVSVNRMGDDGRLLWVASHLANVVGYGPRKWRRGMAVHWLRPARQAGNNVWDLSG